MQDYKIIRFLSSILIFGSWLVTTTMSVGLIFGIIFGILWLSDINTTGSILTMVLAFSIASGCIISYYITRKQLRKTYRRSGY